MRTNIEQRLQQLLNERDAGQKLLTELDAKRSNVTQTLLRIDGAIQVLRELLDAAPLSRHDDPRLPLAGDREVA